MAPTSGTSGGNVIRIKPYYYVHVLDQNTNITRVEVGPQTFIRQGHERVVLAPEPMITIPPRHYCVISNPVTVDADGNVLFDDYGMPVYKHGDQEIRFTRDPFPLYPREVLAKKEISPLEVVQPNSALRLRCIRDFTETVPAADGEGEPKQVARAAGDEWQFFGPGTYTPHVAVTVVETVNAIVIKQNEALKLRARLDYTSAAGVRRRAGEYWLERQTGAYLPSVEEEVVGTQKELILTESEALQLRANVTFTDVYGKLRKAGEQWLVTMENSDTHMPDVHEEVVRIVRLTTLNSRQYCVVVDPYDTATGVQQLGTRVVRLGESSFFLLPGERLEGGIRDMYVLGEEEALLLTALEAHTEAAEGDKPAAQRTPGDRWMIFGPRNYFPPVTVRVVERRRIIPLDENEGIYVRNMQTGRVSMIVGTSHMLSENEELWEKKLHPLTEQLLMKAGRDQKEKTQASGSASRDATRVVTYRAPHNSAVQVYDFGKKQSRVVFGPQLIMLGPQEEFTMLNLSGGVPKRHGVIKSLALFLGPDFMSDMIQVETSDHARLQLKLSYNWHFQVVAGDEANARSLFAVPDFTGDMCKALGSMIRAAVASTRFDDFHRNSASVIREAVLGRNKETGSINESIVFTSNNLIITNIDIQSVEPVDPRTRDALQKSIQQAIEIRMRSQEAAARHDGQRMDLEARGKLDLQRLLDAAEAEASRKRLIELQSHSNAVESTGQATAEAKAKSEAAEIEGMAAVEQARLMSQAQQIQMEADLDKLLLKQEAEVEHKRALNELEVTRERELAEIEGKKFKKLVGHIGAETIEAMALAGPELQTKLLKSLGLKSVMLTDGNSPVNLFNTAQGLIQQ